MNQTTEMNDVEETPVPAPETEVSESSEWEGFVEDYDTDDSEVEAELSTDPAEKPEVNSDDDGAEEKAEVTSEALEEPSKAQQGVEEIQTPEPATAPETPQAEAPQTPSSEEATAQLTVEQRAELRNQALAELEKQYVMSEDDALAFEQEPAKTLPKLAAQVQLSVYEQVVGAVMQQIPTYVNQLISSRQNSQSAEEAFFSEHGDLQSYKEQVTQVALMWNQMNPGSRLKPAEKRAEIAKFARAAIGLSPAQAAAVAEEQIPLAPQAPPQAPPIQPSNRGTAQNPWETMALEMESDPDNF